MERRPGVTRALAAAAVLATAACAPVPPPPPPPGALFPAEITARGNEPFWAVTVRPDSLTLERPDFAPVTAPNPGPRPFPDGATWTAPTGGQALSLTLLMRPCIDSMSGFLHPYTAEAAYGAVRLTGCAAPSNALPRE